MRWYAQGWRKGRQVAGDVLLLGWTIVWGFVGLGVHRVVDRLADPARKSASTASSLASQMRDAAGQLGRVPAVGDQLGQPFESMASQLDSLARQANEQASAIGTAAWAIAVVVAASPILLAWVAWLPRRIAFVRASDAAQRFIDSAADLDLFALRAMANQPMPVLAKISPDPVGAWRQGDRDTIRKLAALELDRVGLRLPPASPSLPHTAQGRRG